MRVFRHGTCTQAASSRAQVTQNHSAQKEHSKMGCSALLCGFQLHTLLSFIAGALIFLSQPAWEIARIICSALRKKGFGLHRACGSETRPLWSALSIFLFSGAVRRGNIMRCAGDRISQRLCTGLMTRTRSFSHAMTNCCVLDC